MWKLPELPWDLSWVSWREGEGAESGDAVERRNAHVPVVHVATANIGTRHFKGCEEGAVTNPMHKRSSLKRGASSKETDDTDDWATHLDEDSGYNFFEHRLSGRVVWTLPEDEGDKGKEKGKVEVEVEDLPKEVVEESQQEEWTRKGRGKTGGQESGEGTSSTSHPSSTRTRTHLVKYTSSGGTSSTRMVSHSSSAGVGVGSSLSSVAASSAESARSCIQGMVPGRNEGGVHTHLRRQALLALLALSALLALRVVCVMRVMREPMHRSLQGETLVVRQLV